MGQSAKSFWKFLREAGEARVAGKPFPEWQIPIKVAHSSRNIFLDNRKIGPAERRLQNALRIETIMGCLTYLGGRKTRSLPGKIGRKRREELEIQALKMIKGVIICYVCEGKGRHERGACRACRGEGKLDLRTVAITCPECGGDGWGTAYAAGPADMGVCDRCVGGKTVEIRIDRFNRSSSDTIAGALCL